MKLLHQPVKYLMVQVITPDTELVSVQYFLCAKELKEVEKELEHINPERVTKNAPESIENNSFKGEVKLYELYQSVWLIQLVCVSQKGESILGC